MKWIIYYFIIINFIAFAAFGMDKSRAKKHQWRLRESLLFGLAVIGGSAGAWLGMQVFHHKTRKAAFKWGIPLILLVQCSLFVYIYRVWL